jgi:hypothetical protein
MPFSFIGFASFLFVGFTLINRILEGAMIASSEMELLNQLTVFRSVEVLGLFSIPVPNLSFFTTAIPKLFTWDYSFFGGNSGIIQYLFYSITAAASFGLFIVIVGTLINYFGRRT